MTPSVERMLMRIRSSWCRETSQSPSKWNPSRPETGQCAVTAALIHEELRIPIVRGIAILPCGAQESHYWNEGLDLTRSQFPESTRMQVREGVQGEEAYQYLLTSADLVRRLAILRERYEAVPA